MELKKYLEEIKDCIKGFKTLLYPGSEGFISESLCVLLFFPSINYFLNHILQTFFSFTSISIFFYLIMGIVGLLSYIHYLKYTSYKVVIIIASLFVFTLFSYAIYPEISEIFFSGELNPLTSVILCSSFYLVPTLIFASNISNWNYLLRRIEIYAIFTVFIGIVDCYFFSIQAMSEDIPNYMVFSYNLLTGLGPLVVFSLLNKGVLRFSLLTIGALCLLLIGARGAQVSFILIVLCSLVVLSDNKIKVVLKLTSLVVFLFLFVLNIEYFAELLDRYLGAYGVHSRTITKLIDGDFFSESGRDVLRLDILNGLNNNPFGYGLFGDRYITAVGKWGSPAYCHNIFLEFCCDFGIVIGPFLSLIIVFSIFNVVWSKRCVDKSLFMLVLLPCGFFKLFFSDSFLLCIPFYAIIGLLLNKKKCCYLNM